MINVAKLPETFSLDSLEILADTPLNKDWSGSALSEFAIPCFSFHLGLAEDFLIFGGSRGVCTEKLREVPQPEFIEGLWQKTLVELFLGLEDKKYLEINLSPQGAYWCCSFSDYRLRAAQQIPPQGVRTFCASEGPNWRVLMYLPFKKASLKRSEIKNLHFSAILRPPSSLRLCYLSSKPQIEQAPDFHLSCCREPLMPVD